MDAVDYLKACAIDGRVTRDQLLAVFGTRARLSEVMNRRRPLSVEHIRRAHFDLGLDASALLRPITTETR